MRQAYDYWQDQPGNYLPKPDANAQCTRPRLFGKQNGVSFTISSLHNSMFGGAPEPRSTGLRHSHLTRLPRSVPFLANAMQQSRTDRTHTVLQQIALHKGSLRCELRIAPSQPKRASSARAFSLLCCVISLHIVKQYKLPHSRTRCAMHQCFRSPLWLIRIRAIRGSIRSLEHLFHPNAERQFVTIQ